MSDGMVSAQELIEAGWREITDYAQQHGYFYCAGLKIAYSGEGRVFVSGECSWQVLKE